MQHCLHDIDVHMHTTVHWFGMRLFLSGLEVWAPFIYIYIYIWYSRYWLSIYSNWNFCHCRIPSARKKSALKSWRRHLGKAFRLQRREKWCSPRRNRHMPSLTNRYQLLHVSWVHVERQSLLPDSKFYFNPSNSSLNSILVNPEALSQYSLSVGVESIWNYWLHYKKNMTYVNTAVPAVAHGNSNVSFASRAHSKVAVHVY